MTSSKPSKSSSTTIARNKRARYDYEILDTFEAGLVLTGAEVKSLREGQAAMVGAFVRERSGELWLEGLNIPPYTHASAQTEHKDMRPRKLLLHRQQINRLVKQIQTKGLSLVALSLYFVRGFAKVEVGLGRGKKQHDKRADIKKRETKRQLDRLRKRH